MSSLPDYNLYITLIIYGLFQVILVLVLIYIFIEKVVIGRKKETDEEIVKTEAYNKALKILEKSKDEAYKIISDAQIKAKDIITSSLNLTDDTKNKVEKSLDIIADRQIKYFDSLSIDILNTFKNALDEQTSLGITELKEVTDELKHELVAEISTLKEEVGKDALEIHDEIKESALNDYKSVEVEIQNYKNKRMQEVDQQIRLLIPQVTKEVMGKTMDLSEHEDLIMHILEQYKISGKFKF